MTIATTATTEFSVDDIVTLALQTAGLLNANHPASADNLALGRRLLFLGLQNLANKGIIIRAIERATLTLTAGTAYVDAASDTQTIEKGGVMRGSDGLDVEITMIARAQYQALPRKDIEGVPSFYFPEQQTAGGWRIHFYPVPIAGWTTFVVPRTRKSRDVNVGSVTLDFDPRWHLTIVNELAGRLARSKGRRDLASELLSEAAGQAEQAMNNETERGDVCFVVSGTPWD
jgi:hypothetical protein